MNADETIEQLTELAAQAAEHRNRTATMTARQKILEIPPADPLRKAFEVIRKQQAEIERLREEIATAATEAAGLRLAAHTACISIRAVVDEIEINRIMTHEERRWSKRLEKIARNLDPYPEHDE